jgi:hypothetical protein
MPEYGDGNYISRRKREELKKQEELQRQKEVLKQNQEVWERMRAEKRNKESVYSEVRREIGAPVFASSGLAGCLSILLILTGIITLIFNSIIGILILLLGGLFFIAGSNQVNTERRIIAEANKEAAKRWKEMKERDNIEK